MGLIKIAINCCYGGFSVSQEVMKELGLKKQHGYLNNEDFGIESDNYQEWRMNKKLIKAIEKVGIKKAGGICADLSIVEIPEDVDWEITEYDGMEKIEEIHRQWA